jgi:hypothetical protein
MGSKLFDVTGNTAAYYNLEPRPIKDVFVSLSPAARLRKRLLEMRRRKPIKVEDASEQSRRKGELDAFMVAPKYRKSEPRRQIISDVKTWADIQNSASIRQNGVRVIQYSQLSWQGSSAINQEGLQALSLTALSDNLQSYAQQASEYTKAALARTKMAVAHIVEAISDFATGKLRPFGAPRTSVHYSLAEGAETGLLYRIKNAAKIAAPALVILLVLALPAYDWTSSGQTGTDEAPVSSQTKDGTAELPPADGAASSDSSNAAGGTGGSPTARQSTTSAPSNSQTANPTTSSSQQQSGSGSTQQPIGEGGFGGGGGDTTQPPTDSTEPTPSLTQPVETLVEGVESTVTDTTQELL